MVGQHGKKRHDWRKRIGQQPLLLAPCLCFFLEAESLGLNVAQDSQGFLCGVLGV